MVELAELSQLLRAGVLAGLALMLAGLALGSPTVTTVGVLTLILTPAAGLVYAALILSGERDGRVYVAAAILDLALILGTLIYMALTR